MTPLPKGYWLDYLVFMLCDGKISRKAGVMKRYTLADAIKWNHLRTYDTHAMEELMAKRAKRHR